MKVELDYRELYRLHMMAVAEVLQLESQLSNAIMAKDNARISLIADLVQENINLYQKLGKAMVALDQGWE